MEIKLFGKKLFEFRTAKSDMYVVPSMETVKNSKILPDFKKMGTNSWDGSIQLWNTAAVTDVPTTSKEGLIKLNEKKPKPNLKFDSYVLPIGPSAQLKNIKLVSNSKIPVSVEKVYFDTDLKSGEALKYLYKKGLDEHSLTQLLSIGITGLKKNI